MLYGRKCIVDIFVETDSLLRGVDRGHHTGVIYRFIVILIYFKSTIICRSKYICDSNMTSFIRFVNKRVIYRLGIISLAHAPVHVTGFPVVNVHVDELSSARIWQHKLCATLSANVDINYCLPIKIYYRICTLRLIRIFLNYIKLYS